MIDLATMLGYFAYHTHDSRHSERGFPDLCLARPARGSRPARLVFAELKAEGKKPTVYQSAWLRVLAEAGAEAYLWSYSESIMQTIADVLAA